MSKDKNSELLLQSMLVEHCINKMPKDSKKKIFYIMKGDGLWQIRKNRIGTFFIHQAETRIPGLPSDIQEGWELNVPLIPASLLRTALSFFKAIYKKYQTEAHVQFYYDTKTEEYLLNCPKQKVTGGSVSYENDKEFEVPEKLLVLEMHSHGSMPAFFSGTDDNDEKDDRFFGVFGRIENYSPEIKLRVSVGGHKMDADLKDIFDIEPDVSDFPKEWMDRVKKRKVRLIDVSKLRQQGINHQMTLFERSMQRSGEMDPEMAKFYSGDYLYPADSFVPEEGEYYIQEGNKKWFVQNGEKIFYTDELGNHHLPDEAEAEDEYEDDDNEWDHSFFRRQDL